MYDCLCVRKRAREFVREKMREMCARMGGTNAQLKVLSMGDGHFSVTKFLPYQVSK